MPENEELDDATATVGVEEASTDQAQAEDIPLGPAGEKALQEWKERAKKAEDFLAQNGLGTKGKAQRIVREYEEMKAKIAELTQGGESTKDAEADLDALRKQARAEVQTEALRDRALDKIEAKAARMFKDPEDALLRLGKNVDDYIDDGKVDLEAIANALDDLLKKRPDFGIAQGDEKRFKGTGDQGPKGSAGKPPQVTEAQLKTMTPDQIVKAQNEGRLKDLLGG